jgi:hypothetical protein
MQSSGEGEWLHRRFHSAVRACFVAGFPDVAPQTSFTSLRAKHWTRLGDVSPEDAYTLHLNRRSSTSILLSGRLGGRQRHDIPFRGATLFSPTCRWWRWKAGTTCCGSTSRGVG